MEYADVNHREVSDDPSSNSETDGPSIKSRKI